MSPYRRFSWLMAIMIVSILLPLANGIGAEAPQSDTQLAPAASNSSGKAVSPPSEAAISTAADLDRLRISSQTWRRGGLGSKALVTFTLRNDNDYAVKDIEVVCSFTRRGGSHLTDRRRTLYDMIGMRSRKTFARVPIGVVNVNADQARCSLVAARRAEITVLQ